MNDHLANELGQIFGSYRLEDFFDAFGSISQLPAAEDENI